MLRFLNNFENKLSYLLLFMIFLDENSTNITPYLSDVAPHDFFLVFLPKISISLSAFRVY